MSEGKVEAGAPNYFDENTNTKVLVIETQGGAGHIQAADQRIRDLKSGYDVTTKKHTNESMDAKSIEKISVLQNPDSDKDSWMKFGSMDIGKGVIRDWNANQEAGNMGTKTNVHALRAQIRAGETIFGPGAGIAAFTTICARPNLERIYDTQNIFTSRIAQSVNEYLDIKGDQKKCDEYNELVEKHNRLRERNLSTLASDRYIHRIEYDPNPTLKYTKVLTDLPTAAEDFYPSLRLMKKEDFANFYLEAPHTAPLTKTKYDKENRKRFFELVMKHDEFSDLRSIFKQNPDDESEIPDLKSFNEERAKSIALDKQLGLRELYDRAYYIMKCPNLIQLPIDHFQFTIGPVKEEFREIHSLIASGQFDVKEKKDERVIIKSSNLKGDAKEKREALRNKVFSVQNMNDLSGELTEEGTSNFKMEENDKILSLMLGSQASVKTLEYIRSIVEVAQMNPTEQQKLFVFTGNYKDLGKDNECLYERVCKLIGELKEGGELPDNLKIIPVENQDAKMISHVYSVADEVIIRTGGLSSMEVEAVCKPGCKILLHSEKNCDKAEIQRNLKKDGITDSKKIEEAFEKELAGTMMPWEEGNAKHIQAQRGDENVKYVNPESYKYQCSANIQVVTMDDLYRQNLRRLENTLSDENAFPGEDEEQLRVKCKEVIEYVKAIAGEKPELLSPKDLKDLNDVLRCAYATVLNRYDSDKTKGHAQELAKLSEHISGKGSVGWKTLGASLVTFALATLVVIGILFAIPSGGTTLGLSIIGALGLAATVGVGAAVGTGAIAAGVGGGIAIHHGSEKGLAKSICFFKGALSDMRRSEKSPFNVENLCRGEDLENDILEDWQRLVEINVTIDGTPLLELVREYKKIEAGEEPPDPLFENVEELKAFIKNHLLKKMSKDLQNMAIEEVMNSFHKGSLLHPVAGAASSYFDEMKDGETIGYVPATRHQECDAHTRVVNFTTTHTGFKVQEIVTQKKMALDGDAEEMMKDGYQLEDGYIVPDKGSSYIYKAQATLNVDCSPCAKMEKLTVKTESNTIVYGSEKIHGDMEEYAQSLQQQYVLT